tara:strand:- start:4915 stop:5838 length:924 start_codon:yes stop_codon:yes gene_type:complete
MKIKKPVFWNNFNLISLSLIPLSLIVIIFNFFKTLSFKKYFKIKTICVGNIYLGGTGKTPLTLKINDLLKNKFKTVFIKKNYTDQIDEQNILSKYGNLICLNFRDIALNIAQRKKYQVAILDDGLQDKSLNYDISITCFNSSDLIGNGLIIPAGPLRERISNISNYDIAFLNGEKTNNKFEKRLKQLNPNLKIFRAKYVPKNLKSLKFRDNFLIFSGIGNPAEFKKTLNKYNFNIKKVLTFPDHYKYKNSDIMEIKKIARSNKLKIITSEKDYCRLLKSQKKNIQCLKIELKIEKENEFKNFLLKNL